MQVWKYAADENFQASQLLVEQTPYIGNWNGRFYAFDIESGAAQWSVELGSMIAASATFFAGTIFVPTDRDGLYRIDLSNENQLWHFTDRSLPSPSVAAVHDDRLFVVNSAEGTLLALRADAGEIVWVQMLHDYAMAAPVLTQDHVIDSSEGFDFLVNREEQVVQALAPQTGEEKWAFRPDAPVWGDPIASEGLLYFSDINATIYAFDIRDGSERWRYRDELILSGLPLPHDGCLYIGNATGLIALG